MTSGEISIKISGREEKLSTQNWKDRNVKHLLYPKAGHLGLPFLFLLLLRAAGAYESECCEFGAQSEGTTEPPFFAKRGLSNIMSLPFSNFSYFPQHSGHCHCKGKSHLQ
jgi:hypothetical protein